MKRIGPYRLISQLARGGMGVVYRARDPEVDREVALKVVLAQRLVSERTLARFQREAEALARVEHPRVVRIHAYATTDDGLPYMAMELVDGLSLGERLRREGPLAPQRAVATALALCEAVAACHAAGVLHRDLKPENVLLTASGSSS